MIVSYFSELPVWLPIILVFIFGTAFGSFLNVLIWRLPREESILGRSHCPNCGHKLVWHDLVPVLSILLQRARCKYCSMPISLRYPLIEVMVGFLFALAWWIFPIVDFVTFLLFMKAIIIVAICVIVFIVDLEHYLILDRVVFPGITLVLLLSILPDVFLGGFSTTLVSLTSATGAFIIFWLLWYGSKWSTNYTGQWMGLGDVKFVVFMGLALGFPGIVVALFLSFTLGAFVGVFLMLIGKKQFSSKLPFGTFLAAATLIALFWGPSLWKFYWQFFSVA